MFECTSKTQKADFLKPNDAFREQKNVNQTLCELWFRAAFLL